MKKLLVALPIVVAGCVDPSQDPSVSVVAFNGDSVTVRSPGTTALQKPQPWHDAKAREACANARYLSTTKTGQFTVDFLYTCRG